MDPARDDGERREAQIGSGQKLPLAGKVFISVKDRDKLAALELGRHFERMGFGIVTTHGTGEWFSRHGIPNRVVNKVSMGRPHVVDAIKNGDIQLVVNTGFGNQTKRDGYYLRRAALKYAVPYTTTLAGAIAIARGIESLKTKTLDVTPVQEYYEKGFSR